MLRDQDFDHDMFAFRDECSEETRENQSHHQTSKVQQQAELNE